jgi:DNA-binding PadR family transcriptional regulator
MRNQNDTLQQQKRIVEELNEKIIKNFLDLIVLNDLRTRPLDGYSFIRLIHLRYRLLLSSGTVYSLLYSIERKGLIEGTWRERKRVYSLTDKGKQTIEAVTSAPSPIKEFVKSLLAV